MKKPKFRRQEWHRYKKLGTKWRKARGKLSKARRYQARKPALPTIGYCSPHATKGLHPSGYRDVRVCNVKDLEKLDPEVHAARISSTVGLRKREVIIDKAKELKIKILNE
ncbi:MAG: 50S ribosomal protein L32e [Methanobacteriaceae archaeon]|nr:50S ribosomal protein L32e [Methanobacteriaceae archaeon]